MLEEIEHPIARLLQEHRSLTKLISDFLENLHSTARRASFGTPGLVGASCFVAGGLSSLPFCRQASPVHGYQAQEQEALVRIRGSVCQTCSATGRLAMEEPNLQTVPRARAFCVPATQLGSAAPAHRMHDANIRCACLPILLQVHENEKLHRFTESTPQCAPGTPLWRRGAACC